MPHPRARTLLYACTWDVPRGEPVLRVSCAHDAEHDVEATLPHLESLEPLYYWHLAYCACIVRCASWLRVDACLSHVIDALTCLLEV